MSDLLHPTISVVVPARNEEGTIAQVVARLAVFEELGCWGEVLVVDDGSADAPGANSRWRSVTST